MNLTANVYPAAMLEEKVAGPMAAQGSSGSESWPDVIESPDLLEELLDLIPNGSPDRGYWVSMAHAVWGASNGTDEEAFLRWSARWTAGEDDPAANTKLWGSIKGTGIGRGWLLREAKAAGGDVDAWLQKEAAVAFDDVDDMGFLGVGAPDDEGVEALQLAVAKEIIRQHGAGLRFNVNSRAWHRFNGSVWQESPFKLGFRLAMAWAEAAAPQLKKGPRAAVSKAGFYEGVEKMLQEQPEIAVTGDAFDQDDWLLGTPGGTVELRTGKLRPALASDMIALSCTVAPAETEACPRWKKFIDWMCTDKAGKVDAGMVRFMRQWAGLCLTGDVSQEMLVFLHGEGANGKGTYIETLQSMMGTYFYLATKDLFMDNKHGPHTEELAALARVRMVAADEVPVTSRWNESLLKGVTGGGTMTGRHLYGKTFTFRIRFKLTISGNDKPTFQGKINEALKRRLHMAEFIQIANPRSETLKAELRAEGAGVLRWALGGLADMLGSPGGKLFVPQCVQTATEDYFNDSDIFGAWLSARVTKAAGVDVPSSDAFSDWVDFRNREGNHFLYGRESLFKAEMEKRGYIWAKTKKCNVYKDIKIEVF